MAACLESNRISPAPFTLFFPDSKIKKPNITPKLQNKLIYGLLFSPLKSAMEIAVSL